MAEPTASGHNRGIGSANVKRALEASEMRVLTGCGMHILVHACCVDSSVAFSLRAQLAAYHEKYCCSVVVLFFCRGSENQFTYKMKCTVNQWNKQNICVVWGGGGRGWDYTAVTCTYCTVTLRGM